MDEDRTAIVLCSSSLVGVETSSSVPQALSSISHYQGNCVLHESIVRTGSECARAVAGINRVFPQRLWTAQSASRMVRFTSL
ncbi:hypothetical protein GDO78_004816 [Eleutherodactylus coqui]|uniref:Uncharacterized protein n=1 Tax=Eleutherodactylus coqui TaxID=57060 RepID=A0A8J6FK95_ELECQ|nr:hypothetical protein GDO78_004816 [Eleutherodactylus coqui]